MGQVSGDRPPSHGNVTWLGAVLHRSCTRLPAAVWLGIREKVIDRGMEREDSERNRYWRDALDAIKAVLVCGVCEI